MTLTPSPLFARSSSAIKLASLGAALLLLAGCTREGDIDLETAGVVQVRSACPSASILAHSGDVTLFDPAGSTEARAIDVVATITNLQFTCTDNGAQFVTDATFDVLATRRDSGAARSVTLPYFSTMVQGGSTVVSKRIGQVTLNFAAGETRATNSARASSSVDKGAASLPADIQERITRRRQAGDTDAAIDPLSEPEVRAAIQKASYELIVGFNLNRDQLRYNVTR